MRNNHFIHKKVKSHKAIAMIELIFAIVIIGITLLSVPNLIYQASESGYTTIQQESIAAAASDLNLILSREWDDAGTIDSYNTPILRTANVTLNSRPGARSRSYFTGVGGPFDASTTMGTDTGDIGIDDIDDVNGITDGNVTLIDGLQDLIDINVRIATDVNYTSDAATWNAVTTNFDFPSGPAAGATSNIKQITVRLTTTSTAAEIEDKEIVFNAFSTNIGSYKLERRELP